MKGIKIIRKVRYTRTKHDMFEVGYFLGVFSPLMLVLEKTSRNPTPTTRSIPTWSTQGPKSHSFCFL